MRAKKIYIDIETLPRLWTAEEKALAVKVQMGMDIVPPTKKAIEAAKSKPSDEYERLKAAEFAYCDSVDAALQLKELANVDSRLKDPAKIMSAFRAKVDKSAIDKNALQICSIGWAIDDEGAQALILPDGNESELIHAFESALPDAKELAGAIWVGHNLAAFDLPALWRRAIKYDCSKLRRWLPHRKFDESVHDLMTIWAGTDYRDMTGLKTIASFLGIERSADVDGGDVKTLWANGEYDKVRDYCIDDVELTRKVYMEIANQ